MWMMLLNVLMGLGLAAAAWAVYSVAKGYGKAVKWWHWAMLLVAGVLWIVGFSWLGAQMGEELGGMVFVQGALFGWGVLFILSIVLTLITFQLIRRQAK
ncbi:MULTISPECIES: hypothetical protein [Dehalococcoides]|jgi:membrane protein DedA with SNARE-associated domain|uniref:Reductive dehalogenase anchoring protein n=4 Tax=Dehalococcoides mccartyi TaxID=61435 RepID=A0A142VAG4_9CHLR|nr:MULTISPECIES: hypothetical protein [Dehalococcoides]AGG06643.1 putative reductive dehalogenase anchoring protein [Dehalococcoides mccartyi DCMB5]AGG08135.1 putative reductive dehalogenase anchoring protein [Dehalococcoides mccartyi BTF08]AII61146.1 dehalogenase [Dehalococcoides mccartyi CG5]AMU86833.1 reductive dehalogenase anchoring protein [Dehalococcoides mccartyi]AOV99622.1 reductive dehalogenase membrane anchor [Dehalococcoides mccartyi]